MKKMLAVTAALLTGLCAWTQILPNTNIQNTVWTGMGLPQGDPNNSNRAGFTWYGVMDTIQGRIDLGKFTMDGMLAWGVLTEHNYKGEISGAAIRLATEKPYLFINQQTIHGSWDNSSYYLNFLYNPVAALKIGIGTRLNWSVGPAPSNGGVCWAISRHVVQGNLRDTAPRGDSVSGFLTYANTYADTAIGIKWDDGKFIHAGVAIADGSNGKGVWVSTGFEITPIDLITVAFAYDGIGRGNSNLYTGATLRFNKYFMLDAYFGFNGLGSDDDARKKWGTGAKATFFIPQINLTLVPEASFTFYTNGFYTFAFFTGGRAQLDITKQFHIGLWASGAWGAQDKRWHDKDNYPAIYAVRNTWDGGFIFNIRPEVSFDINSHHTVAASFEYESVKNADNSKYDGYLFGFFYRYKFQ